MPNRVVVSKLGGPEVLKYENYDLPKNVEENMVRIKQTSIGINYIDTYHRTGIYPLPVEIPFCLGVEAAGDVIEIGDKVSNLKVGDRVALLDQAHYTMVKTSFFNGVKIPSVAIWDSDNDNLEVIKRFTYEDFENKLS